MAVPEHGRIVSRNFLRVGLDICNISILLEGPLHAWFLQHCFISLRLTKSAIFQNYHHTLFHLTASVLLYFPFIHPSCILPSAASPISTPLESTPFSPATDLTIAAVRPGILKNGLRPLSIRTTSQFIPALWISHLATSGGSALSCSQITYVHGMSCQGTYEILPSLTLRLLGTTRLAAFWASSGSTSC